MEAKLVLSHTRTSLPTTPFKAATRVTASRQTCAFLQLPVQSLVNCGLVPCLPDKMPCIAVLANIKFHNSGAPGQARGRQAIQVWGMPQAVQPQDGSSTAHVPPHRREAVLLWCLRQRVHSGRQDDQTLRYTQEKGRGRRLGHSGCCFGCHVLSAAHGATTVTGLIWGNRYCRTSNAVPGNR